MAKNTITAFGDLPSSGRIMRKPSHSFQLVHRPFQIQPMLIAPVLPGETLKNMLLQAKVLTDPILNYLTGWWCEYYIFYVKHRDLDERDEFVEMMLDPEWDRTGVDGTADVVNHYYYAWTGADTIDWVDKCLKRVTECFFRDADEAWDAATLDGLPLAAVVEKRWHDTVILDSDFVVPDIDVDLNANATITASEVEKAMRQWQFMSAQGLTSMTYEEYLATYGVKLPKEETHEPELIRYVRDWAYPRVSFAGFAGGVGSTTSPLAHCEWAIAERADKDRFFKEPGFIFGVTCCRPKIYMANQKGAAVGMLNNALAWLPRVLDFDPRTSLMKFASGDGPFQNTGAAYWVDVRDLFIYGDQFVNFPLTDTEKSFLSLPEASTIQRRFPIASGSTATGIDALFLDFTSSSMNDKRVRQDGVVSLTIAGNQRDTSPRGERSMVL